jgi:lipoate-protein ligase A
MRLTAKCCANNAIADSQESKKANNESVMANIFYHFNTSNNPHETLALEEYLLDTLPPDSILLYLYVHSDSVIIGRHQNVWAECNHSELLADGGILARRISGGGAVFHDSGNLNFSFIAANRYFDIRRQLGVVLNAVNSFGLNAEFSGRNDLVFNNRKFSGNAFARRKDNSMHHGTLLLNTNIEKMLHYLNVQNEKLQSKGVPSVRSRVINLSEIIPPINSKTMTEALKRSFESEYGIAQEFDISDLNLNVIESLIQRNRSKEWIFGEIFEESAGNTARIAERFDWGSIEFNLLVDQGKIQECFCYSDSLYTDTIEAMQAALIGCEFKSDYMAAAIKNISNKDIGMLNDSAHLILKQKW